MILVSTVYRFDRADLRLLCRMSYREFLVLVATTPGVLQSVLLAVALSLIWLLPFGSRASGETDVANPETLDHEWRETVLPLRMEERDRVPKPREDEGPTLPDQPPIT